jgi:Dolichyl-phosphate-mannose-protein mannosyltransferase
VEEARGETTAGAPRASLTRRGFFIGLTIAAVVGFVVRVLYVDHVAAHRALPFDGQYTHDVANGFANGQGWIDQHVLHTIGVHRPTAYFAPLFGFVLSISSWLGADSVHAHQLLSCAIGVGSVVVAGFLGRSVFGPAAGLVAAALAAVHPLLFGSVGTLLAETMYIPLVGAAVLATYWARRSPSSLSFSTFGALVGLAALTRSDGLGLALVLGVPLVVAVRRSGHASGSSRSAWKLGAVGLLALFVVLAPWSIRNALTFSTPVMISNNSGTLISGSNCESTYYGSELGRWDLHCPDVADHGGDESVLNAHRRNAGFKYALHHVTRLPYIAVLRVARTWIPPASNTQSRFDVAEGRDAHWQWLGQLFYVASLPFAIAGVFVLRRRGVPVWPLLGTVVLVCLVSATGYGSQRFRAAAEIPLIVLTAVGLVATVSAAARKLSGPPAAAENPTAS